MRFNSVRNPNYAEIARGFNRSADQIFSAAMQSKPDFSKISKAAIQGRSLEREAAIKAEGAVAQAGINAMTKLKGYEIAADAKKDVADIKRPARRMAGVVGALGALGGFYMMSKGAKADKEAAEKRAAESRSRFEALTNKMDSLTENLKYEPYQTIEPMDSSSLVPINTDPFTPPGTGDTSKTSSSTSGGSLLFGNRKIMADAIAGPESGSWGYDAFNQGGKNNGTEVVGKSGSHEEVFGTKLTDMTLDEIFYRQNTKQRGLSMDEHLSSGGLHAVGRYQFIGSTLQDEVRRMGLDPKTTKFTPDVQDQIFFSHLKRVGNISPWVGPSVKYSQAKINELNSMIPNL